jgi:hypothetical protein
MMLNSFILSTTIQSEASNGFIVKMEEEEDRIVCLEKRLKPNFDDALQVLDSTRISNLEQPCMGAFLYGISVNNRKELGSSYDVSTDH